MSGHLTEVLPVQVTEHAEMSLAQKAELGHFTGISFGQGHCSASTAQERSYLQRYGVSGLQGHVSAQLLSQHLTFPIGHILTQSAWVAAQALSGHRMGFAKGHGQSSDLTTQLPSAEHRLGLSEGQPCEQFAAENAHRISGQRYGMFGGHGHFAIVASQLPSQHRCRPMDKQYLVSHIELSRTHMKELWQRDIPIGHGHIV